MGAGLNRVPPCCKPLVANLAANALGVDCKAPVTSGLQETS
jgi:hypothetical protein